MALSGRFSCQVAVHALNHAGRDFLGKHIALLDVAMTGGALLAGLDVVGVAEEDEVGDFIDADPIEFFTSFADGGQLLDFWTLSLDRVVAQQALINIGQTSPFLGSGARVAVEAFDSRGGVRVVAESNGLRRHSDGQALHLAAVAGLSEDMDIRPGQQKGRHEIASSDESDRRFHSIGAVEIWGQIIHSLSRAPHQPPRLIPGKS